MHFLALNWGWFLLVAVITGALAGGLWIHKMLKVLKSPTSIGMPLTTSVKFVFIFAFVANISALLFILGFIANLAGK